MSGNEFKARTGRALRQFAIYRRLRCWPHSASKPYLANCGGFCIGGLVIGIISLTGARQSEPNLKIYKCPARGLISESAVSWLAVWALLGSD